MPVKDEQGNIIGAVAVFRDISEIQLAEQVTNLKNQSMLEAISIPPRTPYRWWTNTALGVMVNPALRGLLSGKDVTGNRPHWTSPRGEHPF